jgi:diguanylate cyclase (GGDEF)-like protein
MDQSAVRQGNILVVDDVHDNLRLLSEILTKAGYTARPVPDGARALAAARNSPPDLILLDIMMPSLSGYDVCMQLKDDDRTRDIPVIFMSALDDVFDKVKAFTAGGVDYITKPFQSAEVVARVKTHLDLQNMRRCLEEQNRRLQQAEEALRREAIRDPLTDLYNRRYMEESLKREVLRAKRNHIPVGIMMCDIDHFKMLNDTHGHAAGDAVLQALGSLLQDSIRGGDIACRYGGEEFLLLLPDADAQETKGRADSLLSRIKALRIPFQGETLQVTISIGVSALSENASDIQEVITAADKALYRAKAQGRDRVVPADAA